MLPLKKLCISAIFFIKASGAFASPQSVEFQDLSPESQDFIKIQLEKKISAFFFMDKSRAELITYLKNPDGSVDLRRITALIGRGNGDDELKDKHTTPTGTFTIQEYFDEKMNMEAISFLCSDAVDICYSIHPVWRGNPSERRDERLNSITISDNRITYGCVNVSDIDFKYLQEFVQNFLTFEPRGNQYERMYKINFSVF
jgi:hypothetical protein